MPPSSSQIKQRVAISSVLAALFLTLLKLGVGLASNSLGILAEAAHSGLDLAAALLTWFAVKLSDKPADDSHHYGHGKVEGLSALAEVALLWVTCGYIVWEAAERLLGKSAPVQVTPLAFVTLAVSVLVDFSRSQILSRTAKKHRSQALEADALHFSSDILSSLVVIAGLIGYHFFHFPQSDAIAAGLVSFWVVVISIRLSQRAVNSLMDKAPEGLRQEVLNEVRKIEGVTGVHDLRIRLSGAKTFADMRLTLAPDLSFSEAHEIASQVETRVAKLIPDADVMVHADPAPFPDQAHSIRREIGRLLKEHGEMFCGYHNLSIVHHERNYLISVHLLMQGDRPLQQVHEVCDHLEAEIKRKFRHARVTLHVEPCEPKSGPRPGNAGTR